MNKIDFKNIKNQFSSNIQSLDNSVYNAGIFSFEISLDSKFNIRELLSSSNFCLHPIFFSDSNFTFLGLEKEKIFSFSNKREFEHLKNNILLP